MERGKNTKVIFFGVKRNLEREGGGGVSFREARERISGRI